MSIITCMIWSSKLSSPPIVLNLFPNGLHYLSFPLQYLKSAFYYFQFLHPRFSLSFSNLILIYYHSILYVLVILCELFFKKKKKLAILEIIYLKDTTFSTDALVVFWVVPFIMQCFHNAMLLLYLFCKYHTAQQLEM